MSKKIKKHSKRSIFIFFVTPIILLTYIFTFLFLKTDIFTQKVTSPTDVIAIISEKCGNADMDRACYQKQFMSLARTHDIRYTSEALIALQKKYPDITCHDFAHLVGQIELKKSRNDLEDSLEHVDPNICFGGLMHGAVEEYSRISKIQTIDAPFANRICSAMKKTDPAGGNCMHMIGHFIYVSLKGDLYKGLQRCDSIVQEIEGETDRCYNGLFMEHTTKTNTLLHNPGYKPAMSERGAKEMETFCKALSHGAAKNCWQEFSRYQYFINKSIAKTFESCKRADAQFQKDCQLYFGAMVIRLGGSGKNIHDFCDRYNTAVDRESCKLYILEAVLAIQPTAASDAIAFCQTLPSAIEKECFAKIGTTLAKELPPEEMQRYCSAAPKEFFSLCALLDG